MYFKLLYTIRDFIVEENENFDFEIEKERKIQIQLRRPSKSEIEKGHKYSNAFCDAYTQRDPNQQILDVFGKIENNEIFQEDESHQTKLEYSFSNKRIKLPDINFFPNNFKSYILKIKNELSSSIKDLIGSIRWYYNLSGHHNPYSHRGFYWSRNQEYWHQFPSSITATFLGSTDTLHFKNETKPIIIDLVNKGVGEPIYHGIFREAWLQRLNNPRSSIIIGMSAAEICIKSSIISLVPDTEWIVKRLIVPPINTILDEYWKKLPVKNKINNKTNIPANLINSIKEGSRIRNKVVHIGAKPPQAKEIGSILEDIKDLLYLLDYYCGYDFAINHIRKKTLDELK